MHLSIILFVHRGFLNWMYVGDNGQPKGRMFSETIAEKETLVGLLEDGVAHGSQDIWDRFGTTSRIVKSLNQR